MSAQGSGYVGGACRRQGYGKKGRAHQSQESWQSTHDDRRLGRHDDGPSYVKEQRVDACVENPKVTRERSRASDVGFLRRGVRGWGEVVVLRAHQSWQSRALQVSCAIPMASHAAQGGGGRSRPSAGFGAGGTPLQSSVSQNKPPCRHCNAGSSSMAPLSAAGSANSWRRNDEAAVARRARRTDPTAAGEGKDVFWEGRP